MGQKKSFPFIGFIILKMTGRAHGFNAKTGFEKYALDPEILIKMCQNLKVWFGRSNSDTFSTISKIKGSQLNQYEKIRYRGLSLGLSGLEGATLFVSNRFLHF